MTVNEFRKQKVSNTRLAWLIHGHKVSLESLEDFTEKELRDIYQMEDRPKIRNHIMLIFQANVWNTENLI